jgi:hypothetical protein
MVEKVDQMVNNVKKEAAQQGAAGDALTPGKIRTTWQCSESPHESSG